MDTLIKTLQTGSPIIGCHIMQRSNGEKYVKFVGVFNRPIISLEVSFIQQLLNTLEGRTLDG
jgi:hypothetical protein